jgi:predicted DNA-binding transcriptional regulator AlpA
VIQNKVPAVIDSCKNVTQFVRLEPQIMPRGLSRIEAATYIGVSPSLFDEMVRDGRMPNPKTVNSRVIWDRYRLDEAFEELPDKTERNPWDEGGS